MGSGGEDAGQQGVTGIQGGLPGAEAQERAGETERGARMPGPGLSSWWAPGCGGQGAGGGGGGSLEAHSLVSQSSPSQPLGQKQRKAATSSMHVPPLRQGWPRQSSMSAGGRREQGPLAAPNPAPGPRPRHGHSLSWQ